MNIHQSRVLRPTGNLERYSVIRHDLGFYKNVVVTAEYALPHGFHLGVRHYVLKACARLISLHPVLSVNIEPPSTSGDRRFVGLASINLDCCIIFVRKDKRNDSKAHSDNEDAGINRLLEEQHNRQFDRENPLWRLLILEDVEKQNQFTAIFIFHHAIGDGGSGLAFHRTFRDMLQYSSSERSESAATIVSAPETPLLPPLENCLPMQTSWWFLIQTLMYELIWKRWESGIWTARKPFEPAETLVRHLVVPKTINARLRMASKQQKTSVTALLQTLIADVILSQIPEGYDKIRFSGAMSLRTFIDQVDHKSMGVWVQAWQEVYCKADPDMNAINWQRSRQSKQTIVDTLARRGNDCTVGLLKYISDYRSFFTSKLGKPREVTFELSNLGAYIEDSTEGISGEEGPKIGRMMFSQSANVAGPALQVSSLTGGDGSLVLVFSYQRGVLEDEFVNATMSQLMERIELASASHSEG